MYEELLPKLKFCMSSFIWEQIHLYSSVISCANRLLFMFISGLTALLASQKFARPGKYVQGPFYRGKKKETGLNRPMKSLVHLTHRADSSAVLSWCTLPTVRLIPKPHAALHCDLSLSPFVITYAECRWSACSVIHCGEDTGSI